jgi:magnesium-transporting ATPase (P-type)
MNKKGGFFIVKFIFLLLILIIIWAFWLGGFLKDYGTNYVLNSGTTGIEAFAMTNLNLFFFIGVILSCFIVVYLGGGE